VTPEPPSPAPIAARRQRGSVLLLFPAAVLVVIVLAAIAVDSAIAFLAQREIANAVAAAANDASSMGVGNRSFYEGGSVDIDATTAVRLAEERVAVALDSSRFHRLQVDVAIVPAGSAGCPARVRIRASARVDALFAKALPGGPHQTELQAVSLGSPRQGDDERC